MGGLRVEGPDATILDADLPGGQGRVTLAVLAVERRPVDRDALAEIVWDGRPPAKWDGALSAIVSKIRGLLGGAGFDGRECLVAADGAYALRLPGDTWIDREDAQRRLDRAQGAVRHADWTTATTEGTVAAGILARPFLAGLNGAWIDEQRRWQRDARYAVSTVLATAWIERGDPTLAASIAATAIELDPFREVGHRLLMRAEWARGDRGAALRAFAACERVLRADLGADPSPETAELADRIREGGYADAPE